MTMWSKLPEPKPRALKKVVQLFRTGCACVCERRGCAGCVCSCHDTNALARLYKDVQDTRL